MLPDMSVSAGLQALNAISRLPAMSGPMPCPKAWPSAASSHLARVADWGYLVRQQEQFEAYLYINKYEYYGIL